MNSNFVELAVVAPPSTPRLAMLGDGITLCQAKWVLESPAYAEMYRSLSEMGWHVILDWMHPSPGQTVVTDGFDEFIAAARLVRPTEIVVPDVFKDSNATLDSAGRFFSSAWMDLFMLGQGGRELQCMFVPQGTDVETWCRCLQELLVNHLPLVHTIGVPKWLDADFDGNAGFYSTRRHLLDRIRGVAYPGVQIHMLGVATGLSEMFYDPRIRSWDTSLPVAAAQAVNGFELLEDHPNRKFELRPYDTVDYDTAMVNVHAINRRLDEGTADEAEA